MPENNTAYGLGIVIFILSIASIFVWIYLPPNYIVLYVIGSILFFISGLLYIIGGVRNNKTTIGTGFGLGIPGWGLVLVSSILGYFWNQSQLMDIIFSNFFALVFVIPYLPYQFSFIFILDFLETFLFGIRRFNIGLSGSIIHIPIAIVTLVLGIIVLASMQKEKW